MTGKCSNYSKKIRKRFNKTLCILIRQTPYNYYCFTMFSFLFFCRINEYDKYLTRKMFKHLIRAPNVPKCVR